MQGCRLMDDLVQLTEVIVVPATKLKAFMDALLRAVGDAEGTLLGGEAQPLPPEPYHCGCGSPPCPRSGSDQPPSRSITAGDGLSWRR